MNRTHAARVLIVDDDASLRRLLSIRLEAAGYRVDTATEGSTALVKLVETLPDVVITDLRMDGMDGHALFENIRQNYPSVPVIMLTAHGTIPDAVAATQRGAFGYLTKPFDSKELLDSLARAVGIGGCDLSDQSEGNADSWRKSIITRSRVMEEALEQARRAAKSDASILIQSESGTGKELLARAIHDISPRRSGPFVPVNCSAIPEQLLESELFGHVKGAFTGATSHRRGLFQEAEGGTIFLDEIGDMPLPFQGKLLRALQEREVRPLGGNQTIAIDVRIISATHRDINQAMSDGEFRDDLYYRLNVVLLELPPLAERREDIGLLANYFMGQMAEKYQEKAKSFAPEALELLIASSWPGNVRQLQNTVEQTFVLSTGSVISAAQVSKALHNEQQTLLSFQAARDQFERDYLIRLLQITAGNVSAAARIAQRNRTEFYKLLNRHELDPELFRQPETE